MAYNRDDDRKPSFALGRFSGEGNMVEDPKDLTKDNGPFVAFKVAFNSRNNKEYEGSLFVSVTCSGSTAERVLADGQKGKRVHVEGNLFKDEPWENRDGDLVESFSLRADSVSESWRFPDRDGGSSSRRRRSEDEDEPRGRSGRSSRRSDDADEDEPRGRSGRSSRRDEDEDEPRGRSARSSRRSDDAAEDEPRTSRRSSRRGEDEDEPRSGRSRRSRGSVEDKGDDVED